MSAALSILGRTRSVLFGSWAGSNSHGRGHPLISVGGWLRRTNWPQLANKTQGDATPKSPPTRRVPPRGTPRVPARLQLSPFTPPDRDRRGDSPAWSGRLKGVQPPLPFGERTQDSSPGHAGKEGPQLARTGASQGFPRAAAPVGVFSR